MVILSHRRKSFRAAISSGGNNDPNFANVTLLLHGDGANGGSIITDSSPLAQTPTANALTTSTTSPKFGTASLDCTSTNTVSYTHASAFNFGTGDFTVEYWINTASTLSKIIGHDAVYAGENAWLILIYGSKIIFQRYVTYTLYTSSASVNTGAWVHIAHCRSGTTHRLFINGVQDSSITDSANYNCANRPWYVGGSAATYGSFTGKIDDLRVSKCARYTANFTPPTAAFPDS